jgi:hypothetical protein
MSGGYCSTMLNAIRHTLTQVGEFTTHPTAFAVVAAYAVAWLVFAPAKRTSSEGSSLPFELSAGADRAAVGP